MIDVKNIRDKSRWIAFLTSRAVYTGLAMIVVSFSKELFGVELSIDQLVGALTGLGGILLYLINKDRQEAQTEQALNSAIVETAAKNNLSADEMAEKVLALQKAVKSKL